MKLIRIVPFVTTIILMTVIFMFSAQDSNQSSQVSTGITKQIVEIVAAVKHLPAKEKADLVINIHNLIRKTAHFTIYGALGFSSAAMFLSLKPDWKRRIVLVCSTVFCFLYAASDELHQNFVSGRGPQLSDVMLDTFGALCGGSAFLLLLVLYLNMKKRGVKS